MMNKHIAILFLLSFAFAVLSAPVATPEAHKTQRSQSASSASSKSHAQPSLPNFNDSSVEDLYRRASGDIELCEMNLRGKSKCDSSTMGFIDGVWHAAGTVPKGNQCDHILELQLIERALVRAGFCKAWKGLGDEWSTKDKNAKTQMKTWFDSGLKNEANLLSNMVWVDSKFNGEKKVFIAARIKTPGQGFGKAPENIKGYFSGTGVTAAATSTATKVDEAAVALLTQVVKAAKAEASKDEEYGKKLDAAKALFLADIKPVSTLWKKVLATIA